MGSERYLSRIGVDPDRVRAACDRDLLERLQRAHVTTVPFETLSVTGDPFGDREGAGVDLSVPAFYETIVERERGGLCYELNGLFGWLLADLGYDVTRAAARIVDDEPAPPADHLTNVVALDRRYLVDVSVGPPWLRRPIPLDDAVVATDLGVEWRTVESERPDADYALRYRREGGEWTTKCLLRDVPRGLSFFAATCEYYQRAPESPFTGDPFVSMATERGTRPSRRRRSRASRTANGASGASTPTSGTPSSKPSSACASVRPEATGRQFPSRASMAMAAATSASLAASPESLTVIS